MEGLTRYFDVVAREWPDHDLGNLRFYLDYVFEDTPLLHRRVLDIGAGDGLYSFYAASAGAKRVVALEPEAQGSDAGVREKFERVAAKLGSPAVELRPDTFQSYDPGPERFDVLLLHAAVHHLDESACRVLHRDEGARQTYRQLFSKLAGLSAEGARLVISDCSRHNVFSRLPIRNPLQPEIDWDNHQPPKVWVELLEEAGFSEPRVRWRSLNSLRTPGRILLGNRVAAWCLTSSFCLTMTRRGSVTKAGRRFARRPRRRAPEPSTSA